MTYGNDPYSNHPPQPGYGQQPPPPPGYPGQSGGHPVAPGGYPGQSGGHPVAPGGYPGQPGGYPVAPGGFPVQPGAYPAQPGGYGYVPPGAGYGGLGPQAYASWIARVGAFLIDRLIIGIPAGICYGLGFAVGSKDMDCTTVQTSTSYSSECTGGLSGGGIALVLAGALIAIAGGLYFLYLEGTTGQTPGKKLTGIKLIRETDGATLGFGMAFVRQLCHFVDGLPCYLGFLWPIWDAKRQTFADKIISSVVVKV